jgi:hypothetical protein
MKNEFMLYIRNAGDAKAALTAEQHLKFIKQCELYIGRLKSTDKLIAAQPVVCTGFIVTKGVEGWTNKGIDPAKEAQVGYYHIRAENIEEALAIAKENPEFEFVPSASIEVRPIRMREEKTNFVYPNG